MTLGIPAGRGRARGRLATVAAAVCCAVLATTSAAAAADTWPSPGAGGANSSYNADATTVSPANAARLRLAWSDFTTSAGSYGAPSIVNGKVFHVDSTSHAGSTSPFEVRSARTGTLLWSIELPDLAFYDQGVAVDAARGLAVVSFNGSGRPDGVLAVDLVRQRIAWVTYLPPDRYPWPADVRGAGPAITDGARVYVTGAHNAVNTYRLSDGKLLWTVPLRLNREAPNTLHRYFGTATANNRVYVGTGDGLRVYDAVSGRRLWEVPTAGGNPVVAGGRVFVARVDGITAVSAQPCGAATCPAVLWQRELGPSDVPIPGVDYRAPRIGAASATTLFATYHDDDFDGGGLDPKGIFVRLSAATGAVQWSTTTIRDPGTPSRSGDMVWLIVRPGADPDHDPALLGWSATGSSTEPLFRYQWPFGEQGFNGGVAVSAGTVAVATRAGPLLGFRVPGT